MIGVIIALAATSLSFMVIIILLLKKLSKAQTNKQRILLDLEKSKKERNDLARRLVDRNDRITVLEKTARELEQKIEQLSNNQNSIVSYEDSLRKKDELIARLQEEIRVLNNKNSQSVIKAVEPTKAVAPSTPAPTKTAETSTPAPTKTAETSTPAPTKTAELSTPHPFVPENPEKVTPLFLNSQYDAQLKKLKNVSVIADFLNSSSYPKADHYIQALKEYVEELNDAFDDIDGDEDEISTICAGKFSRCFSDYFADNIIEPINRCVDEDKFYTDAINCIYQYLKNNSIYSVNINAGDKMEKMSYMTLILKETDDPSKHKEIAQILMPPFFIRYVNENGRVKERVAAKGSCVIYKVK